MAEELIVKHTSKHFLEYSKSKKNEEKLKADKEKREAERKAKMQGEE